MEMSKLLRLTTRLKRLFCVFSSSQARNQKGSYSLEIKLDKHGVPVSYYGHIGDTYVGEQRSIVAIAEKGLDYWNCEHAVANMEQPVLLSYDWSQSNLKMGGTGPSNSRFLTPTSQISNTDGLLHCADWLCQNIVHLGDFSVWCYQYPSFYNTKPGWRSGHGQGQAISLLIRAAQISGLEHYATTARQAIAAFSVPIEHGGLSEHYSDGYWYEKFADEHAKPSGVLNGMMFSLLALHDYRDRTGTAEAETLFAVGLSRLKACLPDYDTGEWSFYDRYSNRATMHYHRIHVLQLYRLAERSSDIDLQRTADRFARYADSGPNV